MYKASADMDDIDNETEGQINTENKRICFLLYNREFENIFLKIKLRNKINNKEIRAKLYLEMFPNLEII